MRRSLGRGVVRVLEADPDLGAAIDSSEWPAASAAAVAAAFELERGPWTFFPPPERGALGALILEGVLVVRIQAGRRAHVELLAEGDVISPWVGAGEELSVPSVVSSSVVSTVRIALLDRRFVLRAARWPEIQAGVVHRLIMRARRSSLQAAINSLPRIEERLHVTLWALGQRLGRVTPDGIALVLPVTHSQLADMLGAQRPSVSVALTGLQSGGSVIRTARGRWLLRGEPPAMLRSLSRQTGLQS